VMNGLHTESQGSPRESQFHAQSAGRNLRQGLASGVSGANVIAEEP
jgi:hypothetical protein